VTITSEVSAEEVAGGLLGRVFEAALGSFEVATIYLGVRLGLYDALAEGPRTAGELAGATGIDQRYAEEWLEQQAISGFVEVAESGERGTRRYTLSPGQRTALADAGSPLYVGGVSLLVAGIEEVVPALVDAYRTGAGVSFGGYGDDVRHGQSLFNKAAFLDQLAQEWLEPLGVAGRLAAPGATAADIGCGAGWAAIALTRAYPDLKVLGIDSDEASIMDARRNAADAGVDDRARFEVAAADAPLSQPVDVAFYLEALHDFGHPVESLAAVRAALKPGGAVVVMDERAEEEFAPEGSPIERIYACSSVLHCLPVGRAEEGSAATGTLFRPSILRRYAAQAGFTSVEVAPIEHDFFRFYVLS
jgi:2-polyprenyl-3-methyl-5-hydroxy-6-metoxy-1,4-benzoquinol methylase